MEGNERIPANIFEELAGVESREINTSEVTKENVNDSKDSEPINLNRLREARTYIIKDSQKKFIKSLIKVFNLILSEHGGQLISIPSASAIDKIKKAKELEDAQKDEIQKKKKSLFFRIKQTADKFRPSLKNIIKVVKFLYKLSKFVGKILWRVLKATLKIAAKMAKFIFKFLGKLLKPIIKKFIKKITWLIKWVIKIIAKIIRFIYRFSKKLFAGKNKGTKLLSSEPGPFSFNLKESPPKTKVKFKLILPKIKEKISILIRFLRILLKPTIKVLKKFIQKVMGPIFKKAINAVISFIVDFIFGQVLGSIIPFLGNAAAAIITGGKLIWKLVKLGHFVYGMTNTFKEIASTFDEASDDMSAIKEDEEELSEDEMETADFRKVLEKLEQNNKTNTDDYLRLKGKYLESLLYDYQCKGDSQIGKLIQEKLNTYQGKSLKELNLNELNAEIKRIEGNREITKLKSKTSANSIKNILENKELSFFVKMLHIFHSAISSIIVELERRLYLSDYKSVLDLTLSKYFLLKNKAYNFYIDKFIVKKDKDSYSKVTDIVIDEDGFTLNLKELFKRYKIFKEQFKKFEHFSFEDIIEKSPELKKEVVSGTSETEQYCIAKIAENNEQKKKYNLWLDVLEIVDSNKQFTNKYSRII